MPNTVEKRILEEGHRNAIVKLAGSLTTSDESQPEIIKLTDFTNNAPRLNLVGLRLDQVNYSISHQIGVVLSWYGDTPQLIAALADNGELDSRFAGGDFPDRNRSGYNGSVGLATQGFPPGGSPQEFTLTIRFVKIYAG